MRPYQSTLIRNNLASAGLYLRSRWRGNDGRFSGCGWSRRVFFDDWRCGGPERTGINLRVKPLDTPQARIELEKNLSAGEYVQAAQPSGFWELQVIFAETGYLLAAVMDPARPREADRSRTLLKRTASIVESRAAKNPLSVRETELLAKIETLRSAEHAMPRGTATVDSPL